MLPSDFIGELAGTTTLLLFGCGIVAAVLLKHSKGQNAGWMGITAGWGFAVMLGVFVAQAAGAPNADLNPAVSIARALLVPGSYSLTHLAWVIVAEILGGIIGASLTWLVFYAHWEATEDAKLKLAVFATVPAIRHYKANLLTEILATAALILCCGAITGWAHPYLISAGLGPYLIGVVVWAIGLSLGGPTGYAINPARDLGPRIAHSLLPIAGKGPSDWSYAWIPIIGPLIGCLLGVIGCKYLFH